MPSSRSTSSSRSSTTTPKRSRPTGTSSSVIRAPPCPPTCRGCTMTEEIVDPCLIATTGHTQVRYVTKNGVETQVDIGLSWTLEILKLLGVDVLFLRGRPRRQSQSQQPPLR